LRELELEFVLPQIQDNIPKTKLVLYVHEVHGEAIRKLPEHAKVLAFSKRTNVEMWSIGTQVLGIQGHPEFNSYYITEMIINKLADNGRLDDSQKQEALFSLIDPNKPLGRNIMIKLLHAFLTENGL